MITQIIIIILYFDPNNDLYFDYVSDNNRL